MKTKKVIKNSLHDNEKSVYCRCRKKQATSQGGHKYVNN